MAASGYLAWSTRLRTLLWAAALPFMVVNRPRLPTRVTLVMPAMVCSPSSVTGLSEEACPVAGAL